MRLRNNTVCKETDHALYDVRKSYIVHFSCNSLNPIYIAFFMKSRDGHGTGQPVPTIFVPVPIVRGICYQWDVNSKSINQNPMRLESQLVPQLEIRLSQRFLSRDCPSNICPSPKRPKIVRPNLSEVPGFLSRETNPMGSQSHCPSLRQPTIGYGPLPQASANRHQIEMLFFHLIFNFGFRFVNSRKLDFVNYNFSIFYMIIIINLHYFYDSYC